MLKNRIAKKIDRHLPHKLRRFRRIRAIKSALSEQAAEWLDAIEYERRIAIRLAETCYKIAKRNPPEGGMRQGSWDYFKAVARNATNSELAGLLDAMQELLRVEKKLYKYSRHVDKTNGFFPKQLRDRHRLVEIDEKSVRYLGSLPGYMGGKKKLEETATKIEIIKEQIRRGQKQK